MKISLESVYRRPGGVRALYELLQERSATNPESVNISHQELPSFQQHARFVRSKPYRVWFFVKVDGAIAGSINLTKLNEIGIVLFVAYRGRKIARQALRLLLARMRPLPAIPSVRHGHFLANINPANYRSIALFTGIGFKIVQHTYRL